MNNDQNIDHLMNQSQLISSTSSGSLTYLNHNTESELIYQLKQKQQNLTVVPIDKEAPEIENWYHGRLDRIKAEILLKDSNKPGAFLVRESERKIGSFVLSYFSLNSKIHHFKITSVYGDYYIGGRQFDRLETLISYYMYYSELVKGEKLVEPIAPNRVCRLERMYISIKSFMRNENLKPNESDSNRVELSLIKNLDLNYWLNNEDDILNIEKEGLLFRVYHEIGDGEWFWAQNFKTNEYGLLNSECVKSIEDYLLHEFEPWFYLNITKEDAVSILAKEGNCSYLVRPSEQSPGDFTLFFNADNIVHRFRITGCIDRTLDSVKKYFHIGGRDFTSITSIIQRYMNEDITEGYRLTKLPHKRSETYPQLVNIQDIIKHTTNMIKMSIESEKKFTLNNENIEFINEAKKRNSFIKEENNFKNKFNNDNTNYKINNENLSMSLNDSSLKSDISLTSNSTNMSQNFDNNNKLMYQFRYLNNQASLDTTLSNLTNNNNNNNNSKISLMSKSLSSPFSLQSNNTEKNDFYSKNSTLKSSKKKPDLFIKTGSSSSSTSSSNKSNEPLSQTNSSSNDSNQITDSDILENKKGNNIILKGYLLKYIEKSKKWKPYWFSLNQADQQLYYFSDEKKSKEKGLIDLSFGFYYPLDDSFFNRSYCFQIIIHTLGSNSNANSSNASIKHYLCAENFNCFKEWTETIRPLCNPIQYNPFVTKSFSISSSSSLSLSSTSSSSSPSNISLNHSDQTKFTSSKSSNLEQNYRILRTLNLDIHEARNVCFSPLFQTNSKQLNDYNISNNGQILTNCNNNSSSLFNTNISMPKFHKDNLYYCLVIFNNDAIVASTRLTTCNNVNNISSNSSFSSSTSSSSQFTNTNYNHQASQNSTSSGQSFQSSSLNDFNKQTCKDSIWDDSFSFDNLPLDVKELQIRLIVIPKPTNLSASIVNNLKKINNSNKMLDPILIGYVNIRLDELINKGLFESWYNVEPAVQLNEKDSVSFSSMSSNTNNSSQTDLIASNCSIRIKLRFCEEKIYLNKNYYKNLSSFLLNENEHKNISILYEQIIPSTERPHFVQALLRFFIVKNKLIEMLKSFLLAEIDRCSDLSTLFRPATCSTSLMDQYMRIRCESFLRKVIEEPLIRIFKHNTSGQNSNSSSNTTGLKSFELDPSKCPDQVQREQNLFNFQVALKDLINSICNQNSVNLFPNELKHLFYLVRQHVHLKWLKQHNVGTDDKLVKIYCVSAFVFLRLLCPAMLNPKNFGLKFFSNTNTNHVFKPQKSNFDFKYYDLAQQFSVFSPAFMFTLSPTNYTTNHLLNQTQYVNSTSNFSLLQQQQAGSTHQINCFNVSSLLANSQSTYNLSTSSNLQNNTFAERHIKLLAKVLQTLANMTECKEPFMLPLSEFLCSNKPNIIKFIEDISNLNEFNMDAICQFDFEDEQEDSLNMFENEIKIQFENASCKYLAILNRLLYSLVPQMKMYIKKLDEAILKQEDVNENEVLFSKSLNNLINILNDINDNSNQQNSNIKTKS